LSLENLDHIMQSRSREELQEAVKDLHEKIDKVYKAAGNQGFTDIKDNKQSSSQSKPSSSDNKKQQSKGGSQKQQEKKSEYSWSVNDFINYFKKNENAGFMLGIGFFIVIMYLSMGAMRKLCGKKKVTKKKVKEEKEKDIKDKDN
jgi:hypothetical protein